MGTVATPLTVTLSSGTFPSVSDAPENRDLVELTRSLRDIGVASFKLGEFEATFTRAAQVAATLPQTPYERVETERDEAAAKRKEAQERWGLAFDAAR